MREFICTAIGALGGFIAMLFGGWNTAISVLLLFMVIDYVTGLAVAIVGKSKKTEGGKISSETAWKGLVKKCVTLLMIIVAHWLDVVLGIDYCKNGACIAFIANETISIVENAGLLGVPLGVFKKVLELFNKE